MREQRKYRRLRYSFYIKCQNGDKVIFTARCVDMSSGGIRIISDKTINPGDTLDMELDFDSRFSPLNVKGRYVWQRSFAGRNFIQKGENKIEAGIQFLDIDNSSKNRIYNFITKVERERLAKIRALHAEVDMAF